MIDILNVMKITDKIQIIVRKDEQDLDLQTTVLDVQPNENNFIIYNPIYQNRLMTISLNKIYKFRYIDEKSGIYSFEAKVIERIKEKNIYKLLVEFIGNVKKSQRREFFRMEIIKRIIIKLPMDESIDTAQKLSKNMNNIPFYDKEVILKDLSGGGFGFLSNDKYAIGDLFVAEFVINNKKIPIVSSVVRCSSITSDNYKYSVGVKFELVDSKIRREIINFIFNKQRELRKKGLI